jgi:exopolysaccharide production protein ExoY
VPSTSWEAALESTNKQVKETLTKIFHSQSFLNSIATDTRYLSAKLGVSRRQATIKLAQRDISMEQITVTLPKGTEEATASNLKRSISAGSISTGIVREPSILYFATKRTIDIVLSFFGILVLLPVFLLIALRIKLDDGGEVLHYREIIGKHGLRFYALKFRTMRPDADEYLARNPALMRRYQQNMKLEQDPRITKFGRFLRKTSLDELPQLFNVLVGQMSLVGPRIIHPSELPRYGEYAQKRLYVSPGITGLWQISGRQHISYDERVLLDMRYIDNRSFIVDFTILLKTLKVFIVHTGS